MQFSQFQLAIFDAIKNTKSNLFVKAVAGSGKSTTIEHAVRAVSDPVLILAFNKSIADAMNARLPENGRGSTFNSFGNAWLRDVMGRYCKPEVRKTEYILRDLLGYKGDKSDTPKVRKQFWALRNPIQKLVSLWKAIYPTPFDFNDVCEKYDINCSERDFESIFKQVLEIAISSKRLTDFDDQIFYPIYMNANLPKLPIVMVDESQDLNPVQIELLVRMHANGTRIICVGDPGQAIYGFRGADSGAVQTLIERLNMTIMPLSVCYRCAKSVIREAQKWVPEIQYCETAPEGAVSTIHQKEFTTLIAEGDFVICRTTAPLVGQCLQAIRAGKRAFVKGREIGQQLNDLIDTIGVDLSSDEFLTRLANHQQTKVSTLKAADKEIEADLYNDKCETVRYVVIDEGTPAAAKAKLASIFSDDGVGIMFSTIHRVKGLETDNVFIICPELLPHPKAKGEQKVQERNLQYVAATRAKENLYYVTA